MRLKLFTLICTVIPTSSFAFFCPNNFNQIDYGNTIAQVEQICGKPDKQDTKDAPPAQGPQEWNYFIQQTLPGNGGLGNMLGTVKTQISFDGSGKVINISVNGIGVGATAICGSNIQLGSSMEAVKSACGSPALVDKGSNNQPAPSNAEAANKVTTYTYGSTKLIFENGVLKSKE